MILSVINFKGGTGKTTAAAHLAHALAESGRDVVALDADAQRQLMTWARLARWEIPVREYSMGLARQLDGQGLDVVIDTPPTREGRSVVERAATESTHVLVPVAPTGAEYERTLKVRELLDDVRRDRPWEPLVAAVLLCRAVTGASSTAAYRQILDRDGWVVLPTTVPRREAIAHTFGQPIRRALAGPFGDALCQLCDIATGV